MTFLDLIVPQGGRPLVIQDDKICSGGECSRKETCYRHRAKQTTAPVLCTYEGEEFLDYYIRSPGA